MYHGQLQAAAETLAPCQAPNNRNLVGAPHQIAIFHQITNLQVMYLLYDLPIQKVLRHPVNLLTYDLSACETCFEIRDDPIPHR
ncbi:hypothetical protein ACN38_g12799 [Penicillium nordicum]|uniref:Uncharacterized protein n=1 Tax=Penicillium nordicum TaxID=229535 RepID=A0A0M8NP30_9EURO|nr:hypothetical protein ACN38_g12799 [Penicillium nordicum]